MTRSTYIDEIDALVQRAVDAAYAQGREDARSEMLAVLSDRITTQPNLISGAHSIDETNKKTKTGVRQRAPKGIVPRFVNSVLNKFNDGVTAKEFLGYAETDFERMIRPASIRSQLRKGKETGKYIEDNGRWFLVFDEAEGSFDEDNALRLEI